jgi:hypothetical protein
MRTYGLQTQTEWTMLCLGEVRFEPENNVFGFMCKITKQKGT